MRRHCLNRNTRLWISSQTPIQTNRTSRYWIRNRRWRSTPKLARRKLCQRLNEYSTTQVQTWTHTSIPSFNSMTILLPHLTKILIHLNRKSMLNPYKTELKSKISRQKRSIRSQLSLKMKKCKLITTIKTKWVQNFLPSHKSNRYRLLQARKTWTMSLIKSFRDSLWQASHSKLKIWAKTLFKRNSQTSKRMKNKLKSMIKFMTNQMQLKFLPRNNWVSINSKDRYPSSSHKLNWLPRCKDLKKMRT